MSNVTLAMASASVRPFVWGDPGIGLNYTALALPSNGKYKETVYTGFQAIVTDTVAGPTATVIIQGTDDALTGAGVLLPVGLTNSSATVTIPTSPYNTFNVLDGNSAPTGQRTINSLPYQSFWAVQAPDAWSVYPPGNVGRGVPDLAHPNATFPLTAGMSVSGLPGLAAGLTITTVTQATLTLSGNFTGATGNYFVYFTNNYWNATPLGTINLTGGTFTYAADGFTSPYNCRYVRAQVTALTGTAPQLMVFMAA